MLLIVASIPGLITGALVYGIAGGKLKEELLSIHNSQIEQRARNMDGQLNNLELMLSHWAFDRKFDYSLAELDFSRNYEVAHDLTKTLLVMQGSNTMNKTVSLYLATKQGPVLFSPEYGRIDVEAERQVYDRLLQSGPRAYWTEAAFEPQRSQVKDLTLIHPIPGGSLRPFGALLVRLDAVKVSELLQTMTPYDGGLSFFAGSGGEMYAAAGGEGHAALAVALQEEIAGRGQAQGSYLFQWSKTTYTVTYGSFSRIADSWMYVTASPISSITSPVVFVSKIIFAVSLGVLLLGVLLAWLASRRIYSPVNRLVTSLLPDRALLNEQEDEFAVIERQWQSLSRESSELNRRLSDQLPYVKESFLHQLLLGHLDGYAEEELRERMTRYAWQVEAHRFIIIYMQMTGLASFGGKFRASDEGLVTFAAVNIIEEVAAEHFQQSSVINFHNLSAGMLLIMPQDSDGSASLKAFVDELTESVNRLLQMRLTIAVSEPTDEIAGLPLSFEEARHAASQRMFENENQLIELALRHAEVGEPEPPSYPFTLEREFIQALRTGQEATAYERLEDFLAALSRKGARAAEVQQGMLHLLGSLQHAMMISGIEPTRLFNCVNMYEQLSHIREPRLIVLWFREKVCAPFLQELGGRSDAQVRRLIEQAMIYLQDNYMNDISLDNCADRIGTNPFFLSKNFKQVTGKNFIDYLTGLRLDKAKELLRESSLKINDVAVQVGYQHSYFNRLFKKLEGMTPSRYRELSQAE